MNRLVGVNIYGSSSSSNNNDNNKQKSCLYSLLSVHKLCLMLLNNLVV